MERCKGFREQLSLYIDGMLTQQERFLLEEHIKICEDCKGELSMLKETINKCKDVKEKEPPAYLHSMLAGSLRRAHRERLQRNAKRKWLKPGLVSAAAVLLVAVAVTSTMPFMGANEYAKDEMASDEDMAPAQFSGAAPAEGDYGISGNQELFSLRAMEEQGKVGFRSVTGDDAAETPMESGISPDDRNQPLVASASVETDKKQLDAPHGRKIIKNADISLEVKDFNRQFGFVQNMAETIGGYVESSNSYVKKYAAAEDQKELLEGSVVIRVPHTEFSSCIEEIALLGKVINRSTYGNDITLQYMDTETRFKSKEVQQERLIEILAKAEKIEDILNIENELNRIRAELENFGSRLRGWDNLVQYSTINIFMTEVDPKDTQVSVLKVDSLWGRMKRGFIRTTNALMDTMEIAVIGLGYILPVAILSGIVYLVWLKLKEKREG